jgi:hypothetical protein
MSIAPSTLPASSTSTATPGPEPAGIGRRCGWAVTEDQRTGLFPLPDPRAPTTTPASLMAAALPASPESRVVRPAR